MVLTRTDLDDIKKIISDQINSIFNDQFKNKIVESVAKKIGERYDVKFDKLDDEVQKIKNDLTELRNENLSLKKIVDGQEQNSRNLNIRIFGIPTSQNENIHNSVMEIFKHRIKLNIKPEDIKKCHRIAAKNQAADKPSAVLVRFQDVNNRLMVLNNRKLLKYSGINIKEDLTKMRLLLLNFAISKFNSQNVWCLHGNIYVKYRDAVHRVTEDSDVISLLSSVTLTYCLFHNGTFIFLFLDLFTHVFDIV